MDHQAAARAITRARKAYRHALAQLDKAESETARRRHSRRLANARRAITGAERDYEALTLEEA